MEIEEWNESLNDDVVLLAAFGTKFTYWNVVVFNKKNHQILSFETIGRPEMIDLDGDGQRELVASFEGSHLNYSNLEIIRSKDGLLESASVIQEQNSEDPRYAKLVKQGADIFFQVGKVREEKSKLYKYDHGRLIPQIE